LHDEINIIHIFIMIKYQLQLCHTQQAKSESGIRCKVFRSFGIYVSQ